MKIPSRQPRQPKPQPDQDVVAVFCPTAGGHEALAARRRGDAIEVIGTERFAAGDARAAAWSAGLLAARCIVGLPGAGVIVRAVQLPDADEDRLRSALQLNANTFVLGRTPSWRVGSALLPRARGDGVRTGIVAEWPVAGEPVPPLPAGMTESDGACFAPEIAALVALAGRTEDPLVLVDAAHGAVTIAAPTSKGLLARAIRAGGEGAGIDASDVARAVGEACMHAGVPAGEIPGVIARARTAASPALGGGFGCTPEDASRLAAAVRGAHGDAAAWWREHGFAAGLALAAFGPAAPLTRLSPGDTSARPDRLGAILNRLSDPRMAKRLLVAGVLLAVLGPLALAGGRLLVLRWKLPDLTAYRKAENDDLKRRALYGVLAKHASSVSKTMSDLACCAPDGIEVETINITQAAKGQAITVRGKARPAGGVQGSEVIMAMEEQLRKSGAFEGITRSSELPDARGYQEFSISAVAIKPTITVSYPDDQDFAKKSMRRRRFGDPPADIDAAASGIDAAELAEIQKSAKPAAGAATAGAGEEEPADATPPVATDSAHGAKDVAPKRGEAATAGGAKAPPTTRVADTAKPAGGDAAAKGGAPKTATAPSAAGTTAAGAGSADAPTKAGRKPRGALATHGTPAGSNEPEPPPPALSANEINAMTKEEARDALVRVSKARQRADLDDATKERLRNEFNQLLERCKRE
jgi:hypothetical protein